MAGATPITFLTKASQSAFIAYYRGLQQNQNLTRADFRAKFELLDRTYQRELDKTQEQERAKQANEGGDPSRFQNMTVPIVAPQIESAVTYQASVFLQGYPIFGVVANPTHMDGAMQMETILEEQSLRGKWARELILFFQDGFKYNFAPIEVDWKNEVTAAIETDFTNAEQSAVVKKTLWSGNAIKRLDPYNTFVDMAVAPAEVSEKGDFAGYTEYKSRIGLKKYIAELTDKIVANIKPALESSSPSSSPAVDSAAMNYYVPQISSDYELSDQYRGGTNWLKWAALDDTKSNINYSDGYELTTLYARILPSDFALKVSHSNTPQIYKLVFVNHEHLIYAELLTNAHNMLPILIGQPNEDGLGYQTKSLAENGKSFQDLATSYMNSIIASRRRSITDRVLYDPSRITSAHINSANPSAKIPVRPAAYGEDLSKAVYAFPYREDQAAISMQQIQQIISMANHLAGQNQASQGQFVKGNKTLHEFDTTMQNANGRDQLAAILIEHQVFTPLKRILKLNIMQYQSGTTLFNRERERAVAIDPVELRKAVIEFKVSDGLIPSDKLINSDTFSVVLQTLGSSPQLAAGYNVPQLFSYFMKTQGARISEFEKSQEQQAYEQAMGAWQQMVQLGIEKDVDPKSLPPQPLPEQFGYDPSGKGGQQQGPADEQATP